MEDLETNHKGCPKNVLAYNQNGKTGKFKAKLSQRNGKEEQTAADILALMRLFFICIYCTI